jgi:hypothetical protein
MIDILNLCARVANKTAIVKGTITHEHVLNVLDDPDTPRPSDISKERFAAMVVSVARNARKGQCHDAASTAHCWADQIA